MHDPAERDAIILKESLCGAKNLDAATEVMMLAIFIPAARFKADVPF